MAKYLASIVVSGVKIVGRAFARAVQQEYRASQAAAQARGGGGGGSGSAAANAYTGMTVQEAMQILNVKDIKDVDGIHKNYEHLFGVNDKGKGGSFYIQSKIVRAKERLEQEMQMNTESQKSQTQTEQHKPDT